MALRNEYPRPQMRRNEWITLNGSWQFCFDDEDKGLKNKYYDGDFENKLNIEVPFSYQYPESGIGQTEYHPYIWYKREFSLTAEQLKQNVLLCFNGVDYKCDVWVNGVHVGSHTGGFAPFTCDITPAVKKENTITVRCFDSLDTSVPRGKQSWLNHKFGCWYVPNSGIWQSVWIEFFNKDAIKNLTFTPDIDTCSVSGELSTFYGKCETAEFVITYKGSPVKIQEITLDGKITRFSIKLMELDFVDESFLWSPEHPNLFDVTVEAGIGKQRADFVTMRFGMRKISVDHSGNICLNNLKLYQRLILDQGYFEQSGLTPPSAESLKQDILLAKAMGFNGARKHQKLEDPYFYYYADELGFLTWCEMPSAYNFNSEEQTNLITEWQEIVGVAKCFSSVICYVPLNESWGVRKILVDKNQQDFARAMYYITKSQDGSRLVSTNDGWENLTETDIVSIHDYAYDGNDFEERYKKDGLDALYPSNRKLMSYGNKYQGQPVLFTEFGGIAMQTENSFDGDWGYNTKAKSNEEFYTRYGNLLHAVNKMWFQGFCYTQLTDVQQEINGLLDKNHKPKFDVEKIKKLTLG